MTLIDLRELPEGDFVLHFGGRPGEVDALTFSNALIGFASALQEINRQISPETALAVSIDGVGPGSFRARVKTKPKSIGGLIKAAQGIGGTVALGVLTSFIYDKVKPHEPHRIEIDGEKVVITQGDDVLILHKDVWDAKQKVPHPEKVDQHITRAFSALDDDSSVTNFGLLRHLDDKVPITLIPREDFAVLSTPGLFDYSDKTRFRDEPAYLTVVKTVFQRGSRKWEFIWNGIRISAPITDPTFYDRLAARRFSFAQGDQLETILRIHQRLDEMNGVYVNEWYEVITVVDEHRRPKQQNLIEP